MAGIYIPGMEMPNDCENCIFCDDDACLMHKPEQFRSWTEEYKNCPLVLVPDHGRLIDADEHNKALEKHRNTYTQDSKLPWGITLDAFEWELAQAPTIIPADKEVTS